MSCDITASVNTMSCDTTQHVTVTEVSAWQGSPVYIRGDHQPKLEADGSSEQCNPNHVPRDEPSPGANEKAARPSIEGPESVGFIIRRATPSDCCDLLRLIKELAEYEDKRDAVQITEKDLLEDGFGERPFFHCLIAELTSENCNQSGGEKMGFAMYYFTYDAWEGRSLYVEDFFVMEPYRGLGVGSEMLKRISQEAILSRCLSMSFIVLHWNTPSIEYYKKRGATDLSDEEGWHLFEFSEDNMKRMATWAPKPFRGPISHRTLKRFPESPESNWKKSQQLKRGRFMRRK